jgi:uncharacterized protein (TIGR03067 family)
MSLLVRGTLVVMTALSACCPVPSAAAADKPQLDGQHAIIAGERNGKAMPEDALKGCTMRFSGARVVATTKDGKEFLSGDFMLDAAKTPCAIVIKLSEGPDKGKELHGLVERKDDTIRLIYAAPGAEKPTEFKTKDNQAMYTLKCEK